jgi:hypothetical protein
MMTTAARRDVQPQCIAAPTGSLLGDPTSGLRCRRDLHGWLERRMTALVTAQSGTTTEVAALRAAQDPAG